MRKWVRNLRCADGGATTVEYGFILALIVLVVMGGIIGVASVTVEMWDGVADNVTRV